MNASGAAAALAGRSVVITGASSGIGRAIAVACAAAGADCLVTFRRNAAGAAETARLVEGLGRRCHVVQAELADDDALHAVAARARGAFGTVDGWVNNAGADILTGEGRALSRREKLDLVLAVDLRGTVLASWVAAELLGAQPGGGVIVNMSWDHVTHGMAGENPGIYAAAKGGVEAFSKALARDVAPLVRVNVLAPGFIATAFGESASPAWRAHVEGVTPLRRWGTPEDVAHAAVYLVSDQAAFLTGQVLRVNGGVVM